MMNRYVPARAPWRCCAPAAWAPVAAPRRPEASREGSAAASEAAPPVALPAAAWRDALQDLLKRIHIVLYIYYHICIYILLYMYIKYYMYVIEYLIEYMELESSIDLHIKDVMRAHGACTRWPRPGWVPPFGPWAKAAWELRLLRQRLPLTSNRPQSRCPTRCPCPSH